MTDQQQQQQQQQQQTILFIPLNSPGHINSSLGIADRMKVFSNCRIVFLIVGQMHSNDIEEHGHELQMLEEVNEYSDYEVSDDDNTMEPLDEERKIRLGRKKRKFPGSLKWPQVIVRYQYMVRKPPLDAFRDCVRKFEKIMIDEFMDNHDNLERAIESIKPDLIIIDNYYVPPCIVLNKRCPWVRLYSANPMAIYESKLENGIKPAPSMGFKLLTKAKRLKLRQEEPHEWDRMLQEWQDTHEAIIKALSMCENRYQKFLIEKGCEPLKPGKQAHDSPHLNLFMFPKELDFEQDDDLFECPKRWFRCDSLIRKAQQVKIQQTSDNQLWLEKFSTAMENGKKKESVYFSLGSIASGDAKLIEKYVEIFGKDQERLYIISKGVNGDKFQLNSTNMLGGNYLPQPFFLEQVDLAIIHGGNNSVTECLYYGLPMIVMPVFADQIDNAQRIEDLGYGKRLNAYEVDEEKLNQAISEILADKQMRGKCREIGKRMRACDDARKAALMLKKLIENGHLEQSFIDECRNKDVEEINW